jgi:hypothetical protein
MEGHHAWGPLHAYDRAKQAARLETDRPHALRQAILSCRNGGIVSVIGVYGGFVDKFPMGAVMNRSLTIRSGQCHVQRYLQPLLERVRNGDIDPSFVITIACGSTRLLPGTRSSRTRTTNASRSSSSHDGAEHRRSRFREVGLSMRPPAARRAPTGS